MSGRHVGRRSLFAGSAMLLLAAEAGAAKAQELDGTLIAAVDELRGLSASYMRVRSTLTEDQWEHCDKVLWPREDELVAFITDTPARTPEGIQAKAEALQIWLNRRIPVSLDNSFDDEAEDHEMLAMSLARDVLGRAA
jgi:hypothetical protein